MTYLCSRMPGKNDILRQLSPYLFWDVNINDVDVDTHARFLIERIVTRGNLSDFKWMLKHYKRDTIIQHILMIRNLDDKTLHFLSLFYNIDKEKFRCYNYQP